MQVRRTKKDKDSVVWLFIALNKRPFYVTKMLALNYIINITGIHCVVVKILLWCSLAVEIDIKFQNLF